MSQSDSTVATPSKRAGLFDHPAGFWFFFSGGCAERCSYYGMRAILTLYMINILHFDDGRANAVMSFFVAGCYLLPLLGSSVADRFLGNYWTIVYFSIPYVIGQGILAVKSLQEPGYLYLSLGLLILGSGMIKPNISTLMGQTYDQRRPGRTSLRSDAFAMFYWSINIGAAVSSFFMPLIRDHFGGDGHAYAVAFLLPTVLMILSLVVFAAGKPFYATETIGRKQHVTPAERRERMAVVRRMLGLFVVVAVFWSAYDQAESTWVLLARDYLNLKVFGWQLAPDQLQWLNPVLLLPAVPIVTVLWHLLARIGLDFKPTSKMVIGFIVTALTMAIIAWSAFSGAERIVAGAPAAIDGAKKAIAEAESTPRDPAVEKAASELREALAKVRAADASAAEAKSDTETAAAKSAGEAAKKELESARENVKRTDAAAVALYFARNAAATALSTARAAFESANAGGDSIDRAKQAIAASSDDTRIATKATAEAKDLAVAAAREGKSTGSQRTGDLKFCAVVVNQADAAAAAAQKSMDAALAGNGRAARINAAVAGVDAASAVVAAGKFAGGQLPTAVVETEEATAGARISVLWQVIPYILMTVAEICISVVGLELAFAAAPAAMKTFMTACWLFMIFVGNFLNGFITPRYNDTFLGISLTPDWYFLWFAVAMVPVTLAFVLMSRRFNRPATQ